MLKILPFNMLPVIVISFFFLPKDYEENKDLAVCLRLSTV